MCVIRVMCVSQRVFIFFHKLATNSPHKSSQCPQHVCHDVMFVCGVRGHFWYSLWETGHIRNNILFYKDIKIIPNITNQHNISLCVKYHVCVRHVWHHVCVRHVWHHVCVISSVFYVGVILGWNWKSIWKVGGNERSEWGERAKRVMCKIRLGTMESSGVYTVSMRSGDHASYEIKRHEKYLTN